MHVRLPVVAALSLTLEACGGGGPPPPPQLGYSLPDPTSATYTAGDTMTMDFNIQGQSFQVSQAAAGTYGTTFQRADDGVQVSMEVQDFQGRMSQPMQGPVTVDESGIQGPLVFTLDRRGAATIVSTPTVKGMTAQQLFEPLTFVNSFFPRLPGAAAAAGDAWTDTIRFEGPASGGTAKGTTIVTYTVSGDTVVAGRSLVRLTLEGTAEESRSGTVAEMDADFTRSVKRTLKGWVLWDANRRLMTERYTESDGRGTMDVTMAPEPFDFRFRHVSRVRLGGQM